MKKHYFKLTLSICLLIFVLNCENRQDDKPITLIKENYQAFADVYSQNLNKIASGLRSSNSTFANSNRVISVVEDLLEEEIVNNFKNNYSRFLSESNRSSVSGNSSQQFSLESLNEIQKQYVDDILISINNYENEDAYLSYLDTKFESIYGSENLELSDKDFLLTYLVIFKASITFLRDNPDLIPQANNSGASASEHGLNDTRAGFRDWFERNLKCVAGVAGSAISFGLGGCAAGATVGGQVGLLGGPAGAASGALTGCLLGGAIGAIGGGLVGYATFC
ncbi:hypothetical protein [Roseivirga sp. UBA1976]|uniref:hypothetical protein n=1 Tax=Roseivirga sp. UBA1976 TaxID=1947386 RepID=UPI00257E3658|nr:hypothetical protein [Roseivirga sp. UBA1976]